MRENQWHYKKVVLESGISMNVAVATCTSCGAEYRNNNVAASLYCSECAAKIKKEKTAERVRRYRENRRKKGTE
ncbi:hypothetical protein [Anaeroarcus burkinensis]|uniref:hypothetical protein n=1 Tax=Anaeroarcus burkinensis TaxID=82376 RepID=UPI0012DC7237|nr:hypothetical protein [Anaeroarcus burkinensis]